MALSRSTAKLQFVVIRLLRGVLTAWEDWVKSNAPPPEIDPDPVEHFKNIGKQK